MGEALSEPEPKAVPGLRQMLLDPGGHAVPRPMTGPNLPSETCSGALALPLQVSALLTRGLGSPSTHRRAPEGQVRGQQRPGEQGRKAPGLRYLLLFQK